MDNVFIDLGSMVQVGEDSVSVFDETNLFSESDALVGPQGPPGPEGPAGSPGRDGTDGRNATIEIGTVTTGQPGTDASVVNSGTETDAVLNFTIPRGEQGIQGIQGDPGEDGSDGEAATIQVGSVTTVSSEYPATVTNSGTTSAAVLNFQIPQGIQGVPGQDGADGAPGTPGAAATISVGSTTTGNAGTSASVTNSGTSSAAVLDFVIPRGDTGATGATGPAGADGTAATVTIGTTTTLPEGSSATVTNSGTSSAAVLNFGIPKGDTGTSGVGITTLSDSGGRIGYYFDDGLLICRRTVSFSVAINTSWGSLYRGVNPDFYSFCPSSGTDFIEKPTVSITALAGATQSYWMGAWENGAIAQTGQYNVWAIPTGSLSFIRPSSSSSTNVILEIIAIGKWK